MRWPWLKESSRRGTAGHTSKPGKRHLRDLLGDVLFRAVESSPSIAFEELRRLGEVDPEGAWSAFLGAHLQTIDRAVLRVAGDTETARDVAAEVLARIKSNWPELLRRFESSNGRARFRIWLAVVARNAAVDVLRARRGRSARPRTILVDPRPGAREDRVLETVAPEADSPTASAERRISHAALREILAEFTAEQRFLIRVYFLEATTAGDVARLMGLSNADQVYDRVKSIMRQLRLSAEERGLGPAELGALSDFDWRSALEGDAQ